MAEEEVLITASTCAEVAQIHEAMTKHKCTVAAAVASVTERRLSLYNHDLYFFYSGQPEVKATLLALANGHHGYPPSMQDHANQKALNYWIQTTRDGILYLKDNLLAIAVKKSFVGTEDKSLVAREALWELIPIGTCLGTY